MTSKYRKGLILSSPWIKSLIKIHISITLLQDESEQQNVTQLFYFQRPSEKMTMKGEANALVKRYLILVVYLVE